jgi:hypothetical protein
MCDLNSLDLTFKPSLGVATALALPTNLPLDYVAGKTHVFVLFILVRLFNLVRSFIYLISTF